MSKINKIKVDNIDYDIEDTSKQPAEVGKGLSSNDYTTADKNKLSGIEANANNYVLPDDVVHDSNYSHVDNNYTNEEKSKLAGLSNYDDTDIRGELNNKANTSDIPTNVSSFTNDSNYQTGTEVSSSINTHNTSDLVHSDIRQIANEAKSIAQGKSRSITFDTTAELTAWISDVNNKGVLNIGDNLYDKTNGVPDYWIADVLDSPNLSGYYYDISPLDSEVPDITNMATTDTAQTISGNKNFTGELKKDGVNVVSDNSYVHTDNNYTTTEKTKLSGVEDNANNYVLPSDVVQDSSYVHIDNNYSTEEKTKLSGIETGAEINLIEDIKVNGVSQTITNKSVDITIPTELSSNISLYVSPTGDNTTAEWGNEDKPYKTIQYAVNSIPRNLNSYRATIYCSEGTYNENLIVKFFYSGEVIISGGTNATKENYILSTLYVNGIVGLFRLSGFTINGSKTGAGSSAIVQCQIINTNTYDIRYCSFINPGSSVRSVWVQSSSSGILYYDDIAKSGTGNSSAIVVQSMSMLQISNTTIDNTNNTGITSNGSFVFIGANVTNNATTPTYAVGGGQIYS